MRAGSGKHGGDTAFFHSYCIIRSLPNHNLFSRGLAFSFIFDIVSPTQSKGLTYYQK
jgi:hypothetical protein